MNLGAGEIILILLVLLLLFGAKRLPELAKGIGKSLREFKKAANDIQDEIDTAVDVDKHIHPPKANSGEEEKKEAQNKD